MHYSSEEEAGHTMAGGVMRWNIFRVLAIFLAGTMAMALYMTIIVQREDDGGQGTAAEYINLMREEVGILYL